MITYSTCRHCRGLLHITTPDQTVHPCCDEKPTKVEALTQDWLAAAEAGDNQIADDLQNLIHQLDNRAPRLADAAARYAGWGWPVFPLKPTSKQPATRHGFKDATTDTDRIHAWWKRHPDHNIGLPTGHRFDVIDIDIPDGIPTLEHLHTQDRAVHGWVTTASAGTHLYIRPSGRGNHTRWLPGVDYRGKGGYVVAPPSTLGPGQAWTWRHPPSPVITGQGDTYGHR